MTRPEFESLEIDVRGHVVTMTINNPERMNALSAAVHAELPLFWTWVKEEPQVWAVIVTGAGQRAFCTGMDVKAAAQRGGPSALRKDLPGDPMQRPYQPAFTAIHNRCWKPVITAVNGMCVGGGLHFIADSDIVICSENAQFFDTHANVGQVGALEFIGLARRIPLEAVLRMVLLGRAERLDAARALQLGLVSEVVPYERLLPRAHELADLICKASPSAIMRSKQAIWESLEYGLTDGLKNGWDVLKGHWNHPDLAEGPRAFAERREAVWTVPAGR